MNTTSAQGMIDILPPNPPVASLLPTIVLLAIIVCLLVAAFVIWSQRKPGPALRRLRRLQNSQHQGKIHRREAAFILANELRKAFKVKHLSSIHPPSEINPDTNSWEKFTLRLQAARFAKNDIDKTTLYKLIQESFGWVKHYGR